MKNILVTGSSGFIGKKLVKKLISNGDRVYLLIRNNFEKYKKADSNLVRYVYCDVHDLCKINDLPQMDICYNLAAYGVNYDHQNIDQMIKANIEFLINIIDFAKNNRTKLLIHTGTCFEYGLINKENIDESESLNPQSLYGVTKMAGTNIGNIYAKINNVNMITVRPFGVYGPEESEYKLFPLIINNGISNNTLKMTKGDQIRDYLYIDDLIEAYIDISLCDKLQKYSVYNICSSSAISLKSLVNLICNTCDFDSQLFKFGEIEYRTNEVMRFVGDNSKIRNVTGWKPKTELQEGIRKTYLYYKSRRDGEL